MKLISAISIAFMAVSSLFGMKGLYGRLSATNDSAATESESISDFEKAIQIIKKYEGMHQPRHWPFVGYGHKVLRGETFSRTKTMTEAEAEALLRIARHSASSERIHCFSAYSHTTSAAEPRPGHRS